MARILPPVLAVLLLAATGWAGYAALEACGLRETALTRWLPSACAAPAALEARARLADLAARNDSLRREIDQAERELAARQCVAQWPEPEPPPEPLPPPAPPVLPLPADPVTPAPDALPEPEILPEPDAEAWRNRDLDVLAGCWELDSEYRVTNVRTGAVTEFTEWTMCFTEGARGLARMRAGDATACEGPVAGRFDAAGRLVFEEPANLPCSGGLEIYRRVVTCALREDGAAECASTQPEQGNSVDVRLRRAAGE